MSLLTSLPHADFLDMLRQQMAMLFADSPYAPIVRRFFAAYQYRQAFPGLGESGELPGVADGLVYAIERALLLYALYAGLAEDAPTLRVLAGVETTLPMALPIPALCISQAIDRVVLNQQAVQPFVAALERHRLSLPWEERISQALMHALAIYIARADSGLDADPW